MPQKAGPPNPTGTEITILKLLWRRGALAAREVHEETGTAESWSPSTTRTVLERMVTKRLLGKRTFHGVQLFGPRVTKVEVLAGVVRGFARKVLEVEHIPIAALFSGSDVLDDEEIAELTRLVESEDDPARRKRRPKRPSR